MLPDLDLVQTDLSKRQTAYSAPAFLFPRFTPRRKRSERLPQDQEQQRASLVRSSLTAPNRWSLSEAAPRRSVHNVRVQRSDAFSQYLFSRSSNGTRRAFNSTQFRKYFKLSKIILCRMSTALSVVF